LKRLDHAGVPAARRKDQSAGIRHRLHRLSPVNAMTSFEDLKTLVLDEAAKEVAKEVVQIRARRAKKGTLFKRKQLSGHVPDSDAVVEPAELEPLEVDEVVGEEEVVEPPELEQLEVDEVVEKEVANAKEEIQEVEAEVKERDNFNQLKDITGAVQSAGVPWVDFFGNSIMSWIKNKNEQLAVATPDFEMCAAHYGAAVQVEGGEGVLAENHALGQEIVNLKANIIGLGMGMVRAWTRLQNTLNFMVRAAGEHPECNSALRKLLQVAGASDNVIDELVADMTKTQVALMQLAEQQESGARWAILVGAMLVMMVVTLVAEIGAGAALGVVGATLALGAIQGIAR